MILDLNNSGKSIREIAKELNIGKTTVSRVLNGALVKELVPPKKVSEVKIKGTEERITSFSGLVRTNVNEYANEKTGEIIRVAYVKAKSVNEFGYFVKLGSSEKK
jgi:orotate phosphoribosyltransferase-like protein